MDATEGEVALVERALSAIAGAVARGAGAWAAGEPPVDAEGLQALASAPGAPRNEAAVHCCLHAASALLNVAQLLMTRPAALSPQQRVDEWDSIVSHTKAAGRGAYRAALLLTEPAAL